MKEKIYMIPGLMNDGRLWSRLEPLLDEYEIINIPIPNSEDFDEICEIIETQFEDKKVNLLGFSLGSYIASYYAIKNPNKVARLFSVAGTPSRSDDKEILYRKHKLEHMKKSGFKPLGYEKAKSLLEINDDDELVKIVEDMYNDLGENTFHTQLRSTFNRQNILDDLTKLELPVYMYYSIDDRLLNSDSINEIEKADHDFIIRKREGTSHLIPLEFPEELSQEIMSWIRS